ncbi:MAG: hypothetical protein IT374_13985 [Polyangiaceae bacterium]|nr:hypothetical protein [Polyangiaceae bacterium]
MIALQEVETRSLRANAAARGLRPVRRGRRLQHGFREPKERVSESEAEFEPDWAETARRRGRATSSTVSPKAAEGRKESGARDEGPPKSMFNSSPASPVYRYLTEQERLRGAQAALGQIDPTRRDGWATAGFLRLRMHLDHVFAAGGIELESLDDTLPFDDVTSRFHGLSYHAPTVVTLGA